MKRVRSPLAPALAGIIAVAVIGADSSGAHATATYGVTTHVRRHDFIQKTGVDACPRVGEAPMPIACAPQIAPAPSQH